MIGRHIWASHMALMVTKPPANVGDIRETGSKAGRRSPGGRHDNPLQYSYLESPTDRGA